MLFLENNFFKSSSEKHIVLKEKILNEIKESPSKENIEDAKISNQDWTIDRDIKRNYSETFKEIIREHLTEQTKLLHCSSCEVKNFWFQQYENGDTHDWHTHPESQFSNIYFIECTKENSTEFKKIGLPETFQIDIKEGEILSFPSFYMHRSKPILDKSRKTVIAFNTCFL